MRYHVLTSALNKVRPGQRTQLTQLSTNGEIRQRRSNIYQYYVKWTRQNQIAAHQPPRRNSSLIFPPETLKSP